MIKNIKQLVNIPYEFSYDFFKENKLKIEESIKNTTPQCLYFHNQGTDFVKNKNKSILSIKYRVSNKTPISLFTVLKDNEPKKERYFSKYVYNLTEVSLLPDVMDKLSYTEECKKFLDYFLQEMIDFFVFLENKDTMESLQNLRNKFEGDDELTLSDADITLLEEQTHFLLKIYKSEEKHNIEMNIGYIFEKIKESRDLFYLFELELILHHLLFNDSIFMFRFSEDQ